MITEKILDNWLIDYIKKKNNTNFRQWKKFIQQLSKGEYSKGVRFSESLNNAVNHTILSNKKE